MCLFSILQKTTKTCLLKKVSNKLLCFLVEIKGNSNDELTLKNLFFRNIIKNNKMPSVELSGWQIAFGITCIIGAFISLLILVVYGKWYYKNIVSPVISKRYAKIVLMNTFLSLFRIILLITLIIVFLHRGTISQNTKNIDKIAGYYVINYISHIFYYIISYNQINRYTYLYYDFKLIYIINNEFDWRTIINEAFNVNNIYNSNILKIYKQNKNRITIFTVTFGIISVIIDGVSLYVFYNKRKRGNHYAVYMLSIATIMLPMVLMIGLFMKIYLLRTKYDIFHIIKELLYSLVSIIVSFIIYIIFILCYFSKGIHPVTMIFSGLYYAFTLAPYFISIIYVKYKTVNLINSNTIKKNKKYELVNGNHLNKDMESGINILYLFIYIVLLDIKILPHISEDDEITFIKDILNNYDELNLFTKQYLVYELSLTYMTCLIEFYEYRQYLDKKLSKKYQSIKQYIIEKEVSLQKKLSTSSSNNSVNNHDLVSCNIDDDILNKIKFTFNMKSNIVYYKYTDGNEQSRTVFFRNMKRKSKTLYLKYKQLLPKKISKSLRTNIEHIDNVHSGMMDVDLQDIGYTLYHLFDDSIKIMVTLLCNARLRQIHISKK